jgi:predicted RNA polymerase sigma factor
VAEAPAEALAHWPERGIPERPAAWLLTTARHKALDRIRREGRYREKLRLLGALGRRWSANATTVPA